MPVKIRLMRIGAKKRPFYRVVAVDEREKRNGEYLELLGTVNPLTQPKEINLKQDRIEHWQKQGAVISHGLLRVLGQAPQKPPRKPKKDKQPDQPKAPTTSPQQPTEPAAAESQAQEETVAPEAMETHPKPQPEAEEAVS